MVSDVSYRVQKLFRCRQSLLVNVVPVQVSVLSWSSRRGHSPSSGRGHSPSSRRGHSPSSRRGQSPSSRRGHSPSSSRGQSPSSRRGQSPSSRRGHSPSARCRSIQSVPVSVCLAVSRCSGASVQRSCSVGCVSSLPGCWCECLSGRHSTCGQGTGHRATSAQSRQ